MQRCILKLVCLHVWVCFYLHISRFQRRAIIIGSTTYWIEFFFKVISLISCSNYESIQFNILHSPLFVFFIARRFHKYSASKSHICHLACSWWTALRNCTVLHWPLNKNLIGLLAKNSSRVWKRAALLS